MRFWRKGRKRQVKCISYSRVYHFVLGEAGYCICKDSLIVIDPLVERHCEEYKERTK